MTYAKSAYIVTLLILGVILFIYSCGGDKRVDPDDALTIACPPDTVVPINFSSPEQIGIYPMVTSTCMDDPPVTSRDSVPTGMSGGLIRIWKVSDTCGNAESCLQHIGQGAPR